MPAARGPAPSMAEEPVARPHVLILRDPRESRGKCSLTPLRGRPGIRFVELRHGPKAPRVAVQGRILLDPEGEPLSAADAGRDLLLIDCSWRRLPRMRQLLEGEPLPRRLPPLATGYPRRSKSFEDPREGLASIEALFAALTLLGHEAADLLEGYHWRETFLARNPDLCSPR